MRSVLAVSLLLLSALSLRAEISPLQLEEAAEVARRAAAAAVAGQRRVFFEALDVDGLLAGRIGAEAWNELTERQRALLRSAARETFVRALSPEPLAAAAGQIAWSSARAAGSRVEVFLGISFKEKILKTRWKLERSANGWRVTDVVLTDPGISLAASALAGLDPRPVRRRERARMAWSEALPRGAGLAILVLGVLLASHRVPPNRRALLYLAAAVPAFLFLFDGARAVRRTLSEPYALEPAARGSLVEGQPPAPLEYRNGVAARERGEKPAALEAFRRALAEKEPAPGAARELAELELEAGRYEEALDLVRRYQTLAGPDPDALSLEAVVLTNLGRTPEAVLSIEQARRLVAEGGRGAELEARIRARAGDAAGAVAALESLEREGRLDRRALRADPAYLPIAVDPIWVKFVNEKSTVKAR